MKNFCIILLSFLVYTFSANASITLQECRDKARENYPLVRRYDLIRVTKELNGTIRVDGKVIYDGAFYCASFGNGRYFGGG